MGEREREREKKKKKRQRKRWVGLSELVYFWEKVARVSENPVQILYD